jgi:hypothetical protein
MSESPRAQRIRIAREMQLEYKRRLARRLGGEGAAPIPLNKGGGDFPSAGAAETVVSARKKKKRLSVDL